MSFLYHQCNIFSLSSILGEPLFGFWSMGIFSFFHVNNSYLFFPSCFSLFYYLMSFVLNDAKLGLISLPLYIYIYID